MGDIDFSKRRKMAKGSPSPARTANNPDWLCTHIAPVTNQEMALRYGNNFCILLPPDITAQAIVAYCSRFQEACCAGTTTYREAKTAEISPDGKAKVAQLVHTVCTQAQLSLARTAAETIFEKPLNQTRNALDVPVTRSVQVSMDAGRLSVKGDTLTIKEAMYSIGPEGDAAICLWKWDSGTASSIATPTEEWPYARLRAQLVRLLALTGLVIEGNADEWYALSCTAAHLRLLTTSFPYMPADNDSSKTTSNSYTHPTQYPETHRKNCQNCKNSLLQDTLRSLFNHNAGRLRYACPRCTSQVAQQSWLCAACDTDWQRSMAWGS